MISKPCATDFRLDNTVAVITGAASGIGLAIAKLFAERGALVCLCDRSEKALQAVVEQLPGSRGYSLDISDFDTVNRVVLQIERECGAIHVLVNSAGVGDIDWAEKITPDLWKKVIDVNLSGTFYMSQSVGKQMIAAQNGGKIISLASQAGLVAIDQHTAYSASKAGIISITKSLAYEWGKYGIQVNCISPTATETPIIAGYWDEPQRLKKTLENTPAGRYCKPVEIACAALFLASQASNMITGENLVVDGGYTIH